MSIKNDEGGLVMSDLGKWISLASSTLDRFRLDGRIALLVGGGGGLGQAMALALSAAGADVGLVDLKLEDLKKTGEAISRLRCL
jgi:2-polyprenyl-6-methoxyphenol hydroxylase-like FAD-dependent oxidoreductase